MITAIIPYLDEGNRVFTVLDTLVKIPQIGQIICVDDGSADSRTHNRIAKQYSNAIAIRSEKNLGKAGAIALGLKKAIGDTVYLLDADYRKLVAGDMTHAIELFKDQKLDMLIIKIDQPIPLLNIWTRRFYGIFAGQRLLYRSDLTQVYRLLRPQGYELEIAINKFMIEKRKKVSYISMATTQYPKYLKYGLIKGEIAELKMHAGLMRFAGLGQYIKQLLFFCRNKAQ